MIGRMPELPHSATPVASQAQTAAPSQQPGGAAARMDAKTRIRLRIAAFAGADYAVNVLILFCYAAVGTIGYRVPWLIFGLSLVANAVFLGGIASGLSKRLPTRPGTCPHGRDPGRGGTCATEEYP